MGMDKPKFGKIPVEKKSIIIESLLTIVMNQAQAAVRNAGFLLIQRGTHILASLLFAIWVPRMMGPGDYGRYALINSLYIWFVIASDPGFTQIMGRYVPHFMFEGKREGLQKLFGNLLAVSLLSGAIGAGFYLSLTGLWLTDLDFVLFLIVAATLIVRAGSRPFFTLFLGLNQAAHWGMGETLRHWLVVAFVIMGFYVGGLRGAFMGLFLTEWIVLFIGLWWGRSYFSWRECHLDIRFLTPYLQFGSIYLIFNLFSSTFQYSGEVLVRLFYPDYAEVGYLGLANTVYFTISMAIHQLMMAFVPFMMTLQARGETETLKQWMEHLLNWLTAGMVFAVWAVLLLGNDLVPLVLGATYQPVVANLLLLSLTLCVHGLNQVAILHTLVYNRPMTAAVAAGMRLAAIWSLGPFLVAKWGSLGGCFALFVATIIYSVYLTWRMKEVVAYSLRKWAWIIGLGLIFLPLLWLKSSWIINALLYAVFGAGYSVLLLLLRIITFSEAVAVGQAFRSKNVIFNASNSARKEYLDV